MFFVQMPADVMFLMSRAGSSFVKTRHTAAQLFSSFEEAADELAAQICTELMVHTLIEEEIFYPACRGHMEEGLLDEAQVEHDGGKALIMEICRSE
jgi:hypothetical protein